MSADRPSARSSTPLLRFARDAAIFSGCAAAAVMALGMLPPSAIDRLGHARLDVTLLVTVAAWLGMFSVGALRAKGQHNGLLLTLAPTLGAAAGVLLLWERIPRVVVGPHAYVYLPATLGLGMWALWHLRVRHPWQALAVAGCLVVVTASYVLDMWQSGDTVDLVTALYANALGLAAAGCFWIATARHAGEGGGVG